MNYDIREAGQINRVTIWKLIGGRHIEKEIELPFKPCEGLQITIDETESHLVSEVTEGSERQFRARCTTLFECVAKDPLLVQPRWTSADYDEYTELHLAKGWSEKELELVAEA